MNNTRAMTMILLRRHLTSYSSKSPTVILTLYVDTFDTSTRACLCLGDTPQNGHPVSLLVPLDSLNKGTPTQKRENAQKQ